MTTTIENLHSNKRKFISDDEVYPPSARILSIACQIEASCNAKKIKSTDTERSSSSIGEADDMMICENAAFKANDTHKADDPVVNKSQALLIPEDCNGVCNADASPTTLIMRCYCDPYRLNAFIPYNSDIY